MQMTSELKARMTSHIEDDIENWPASCNDLMMACNNMSDFSKDERAWFGEHLPHGTYKTPKEVEKALHL